MPSEIIDYIILVFLIIGFILGFKDGLLKKVLTFVGFVLAIIGAFTFSPKLRVILINFFDFETTTAVILSFIIIFMVIIIISKLLIKFLQPKKSVLGFMDRILGALLGTFQMGLFLSGLLIFLSIFDIPNVNEKSNLKYYSFTYNLMPNTFSFVKKIFPETEVVFDIFDKLKDRLDKDEDGNIR